MNTLECIKTRHSTRKFKADQLSRELIDQVLDAGRRAPSGGNTQLTHFMVITNQDVLKELVTLVQEEYGKMPITENTLPYMVNIIKMSPCFLAVVVMVASTMRMPSFDLMALLAAPVTVNEPFPLIVKSLSE